MNQSDTKENASEKATGMGTNENVEGGNADMKQATVIGRTHER